MILTEIDKNCYINKEGSNIPLDLGNKIIFGTGSTRLLPDSLGYNKEER